VERVKPHAYIPFTSAAKYLCADELKSWCSRIEQNLGKLFLSPNSYTIREISGRMILPYIDHHIRSDNRFDLVFDKYFKNSLKSGTRSIRGSVVRRLVKANGKMPNNWPTFLSCDENKTELFPFIIKVLVESIDTRRCHVDYSWGL
jgi:hypothetical protein